MNINIPGTANPTSSHTAFPPAVPSKTKHPVHCFGRTSLNNAKMPRDLLADKKTLDGMPKLSRNPDTVASPEPVEQSSNSLVPHRSSHIAQEERLKQMGVRPYSSLLNLADLDDCDWLEHAAFDPIEAASREKVRTTFLPQCWQHRARGLLPSSLSLSLSHSTTVGHRRASSSALCSIFPALPRSRSLHFS